MNIGIYGGSFNPPHRGHFKVMEAVIKELGLEQLFLIPSSNPPHKPLPLGSPSNEERFYMVDALADLLTPSSREEKTSKKSEKSSCVVKTLDLEMQRQGKSYTVDTLKVLREEHPSDEFWLIMGEDMLFSFGDWAFPEEIAKMANICTFPRSNKKASTELVAQSRKVAEDFGCLVKVISVEDGVTASSTQVREQLTSQKFSPDLLPCIAGRILSQGSYGLQVSLGNLDLPLLRSVVWGEVKSKRVPHIKGVEDCCVKLAAHWGEDETQARRAGILHDLSKYWSQEAHLAFCDKYGYPLTDLERETEKLLHAKSGAAYAKEILKEQEAVWRAIDCHTTGKANMSALDKILYLADYIEVNRDFPELQTMRRLAYEDLDKAVGLGLQLALQEMNQRNKVIHEQTLEAYAQYGS